MNINAIKNKVENGIVFERVAKKAVRIKTEEYRFGFYVTCVAKPEADTVEIHNAPEPERLTHYLVLPEADVQDITADIRDGRVYTLLYAEDEISPRLSNMETYFGKGSITLKGKAIRQYFVKGFLDADELEEAESTVTITCDPFLQEVKYYYVYNIFDELILSGNDFDKLIEDVKGKGYSYVEYLDTDGKARYDLNFGTTEKAR